MKDHTRTLLLKYFIEFTENYRRRATRLDARILFRMNLSELNDFPNQYRFKIYKKMNQFISEYTSLKNYFNKPAIRNKHISDFNTYLQHIQEQTLSPTKSGSRPLRTDVKLEKKKEINISRSL